MKNLGIAFLACVSLASFGCKKKGGDVVGKMTEFKDKMCKCTDKACVDKVEKEEADAMAEMAKGADPGAKADKPDPELTKKMMDVGMAKMDCRMKAMGAPTMGGSAAMTPDKPADGSAAMKPADGSAAAGSAAAPAGGGDMAAVDMSAWPQECKDYKAAVDAMMKCDKPGMAAARDGMKTGFETMSKAWASIPAASMKATMDASAAGCKAGADAINTSMKSMGC